MPTAASRTCATNWRKLACMRPRSAISPSVAGPPWSAAPSVKSPSATRRKALRAWARSPPNSRRRVRSMTPVRASAATAATRAKAAASSCMRLACAWVAALAVAAAVRAVSSCCSKAERSARQAGVSCVLSKAAAWAASLCARACTCCWAANWWLRSASRACTSASKAVPRALASVAVCAWAKADWAASKLVYAVRLAGSSKMLRSAWPLCKPWAYISDRPVTTACSTPI